MSGQVMFQQQDLFYLPNFCVIKKSKSFYIFEILRENY